MQHYRILARLGVEPRPSGYIPGALPLSYLALGIRWYCSSITTIVADWTSNSKSWVQALIVIYIRKTPDLLFITFLYFFMLFSKKHEKVQKSNEK